MNRSWMNNQNSAGFVYYNLDTTPMDDNNKETPDFLQFSECSPSPQSKRFNPSNFSSPYHNRRASPRGFNKRSRIRSGNQQNMSYSSNSSYDMSTYNNSSWIHSRDNSSFGNKSRNDSFHKTNLLHPSFTEDPWAALERQLDHKEGVDRLSISDKLNQSSSSISNCNKKEHTQTT